MEQFPCSVNELDDWAWLQSRVKEMFERANRSGGVFEGILGGLSGSGYGGNSGSGSGSSASSLPSILDNLGKSGSKIDKDDPLAFLKKAQ